MKLRVLFPIFYFFLLWSRIYVISGAYNLPIDSSMIQIVYVGLIVLTELIYERKLSISKNFSAMGSAIILLIGYWIIFAFVFVNQAIASYTQAIAQRQGLFLTVVIVTALFVRKHKLFSELIQTSFWTVAFVLAVQFISNITDVMAINIGSIFDVSTRSRVSFGLGHYNNLGMLCACEIVIGIWLIIIQKKKFKNAIYCVLFLSAIMLLGSASRNAIFGLLVFILVEMYLKLDKYPLKNFYKFLVKVLIVSIVAVLILFGDDNISINNILLDSNRMTLFTVAIPTFMASNRTWIGLGLASGEIYGQNLTPYTTYWLDNGYIYTLITTGYIGAIIYFALIVLFIWKFVQLRRKNRIIGSLYLGTFYMYLFGALFETTLFNGGVLQNYLLIPIFLIGTSKYFDCKEETKLKEYSL